MQVATVKLQKSEKMITRSESGEGAVDALYSAIIKAVDQSIDLMEYRIHNLGRGKESLGKVVVQIKHEGKLYQGKAIEKDVMKASGIALINAINKTLLDSTK